MKSLCYPLDFSLGAAACAGRALTPGEGEGESSKGKHQSKPQSSGGLSDSDCNCSQPDKTCIGKGVGRRERESRGDPCPSQLG